MLTDTVTLRKRLKFISLLFVATLMSCTPSVAPAMDTPAPTHTPLPTATATPLPPTPTPTPTPEPTPTPQPLITVPADGLPHYAMNIALNFADRNLEVAQRILTYNPTTIPWDKVVLSVPPAHQPELFSLYVVEVTTEWATEPVTYTLDSTMLHVQLPTPVLSGEPVEIYLSFSMQIPPVDPAAWPPLGNFGAGERLVQVGDWHPVLVPYTPGQGWQTWTYHPVGDPVVYGIANYDVEILAPAEIVIAAAGELLNSDAAPSTGAIRRYHLDRARAFAFLASPEYQVIVGQAGALQVKSYVLPEYTEGGQAVLDTAEQAIALYEEYYGPYPYPALSIAQNAYYGAMEYSGLVSMTGYGYQAYKNNPADLLVVLTAHEIAHQWWYGAVGNDQVHEPWLDEAFAKYSELLFYERYFPELTDWWWNNHIYRFSPNSPLDSTIYDFEDSPTYIHEIYGQGARFMADLRVLMGDPDFFAFVRDYRDYGEGRLVTREDFFAAARLHTDADLTPLVNRYFSSLP